jgi:hypothetical protein
MADSESATGEQGQRKGVRTVTNPINYDALNYGSGALPTLETLTREVHQLHPAAQNTLYSLAFRLLAAIASETQIDDRNRYAVDMAQRMVNAE